MTSKIEARRIPLPFDTFRYEYDWVGEDVTAQLSGMYSSSIRVPSKIGSEFWLGHLNLITVDYSPERRMYEVALAGGRGFQAAIRRKLYYRWQDINARIILTLYVWGLADFREGHVVSWRNVHWGRKI